jgi:acetylglutamate synthase
MNVGDQTMNPPLQGLSSHFDSHICRVTNENDSGSTNEDEEDEISFMQVYAHLSLEDKAVILKLLKRAREQSEALHKLEDVLITKIQSLE